MGCATVNDLLRLPTEHLGEELYFRASYLGVMINLITREEYPMGVGLINSTFQIGRSVPASDTETWNKVATLMSGAASPGACATTWNDAKVGFNETTFQPEDFGLRGPVLCSDELIYNHNAEEFVDAYLGALDKRIQYSIENRLLNLYSHFVPKHITVNATTFTKVAGSTSNVPTGGPTITAAAATCELSQEHLDTVAAELNREGAMMGNSDGWIQMGENGPEYVLWIGQEASAQLALNNAEFRQDLRWGQANQLLKRLGASRVLKNFRHLINLFPPRYNHNGTSYVRVNTWRMTPGTKGDVGEINPEYLVADFEAAFVLTPWVFRSQIVRPVNSAAGLNWGPKNYMGNWQWVIGGKEITDPTEEGEVPCYDPLKKLGRHFAEFKHAPKPIHPVFGRMILFRNCANADWPCTTCFGT